MRERIRERESVCVPGSRLFFRSALLCCLPIHGGHSAIDNHRNIDSEIRTTEELHRSYIEILETVVIFLMKMQKMGTVAIHCSVEPFT